jgi:glycine cleavage system H protein
MKTSNQKFLFTKTHEWLSTNNTPMAVGISDHAQNLLGDIVFVQLPKVNSHVKAGQELGVLESVKAAADYYAPIDGVITEVNEIVQQSPELINQDPYGKGWICKISPDKEVDQNTLFSEESYLNLVAE